MHGTRRLLLGGSVSPPRAPQNYYVYPTSTDTILNVALNVYPKTTSLELYISTDGVNYSISSFTNIYPGAVATGTNILEISSLTKNTKYYFKAKAVNAGGKSAFSNVHFSWPVGYEATAYANFALGSDFAEVAYEMEEFNLVDLFFQSINGNGILLNSCFLFSPSGGLGAQSYDSITQGVGILTGGSYSGAGLSFNYDGYFSTELAISDVAAPDAYMVCMNQDNAVSPPTLNTDYAFWGIDNSSYKVGVSQHSTAIANLLVAYNGDIELAAHDLSAGALGNFITAGAGADVSEKTYISWTPAFEDQSAQLTHGPWPAKALYIGAMHDGSDNPVHMHSFDTNFFAISSSINYADRLNIYYAQAAFNTYFSRF